jgi:hypothetical protein
MNNVGAKEERRRAKAEMMMIIVDSFFCFLVSII